jgi:integrase
MAVKLMRQRSGAYRAHWYGVYVDGGKRTVVNLGVEWKGTPPGSGSLRDNGDSAFEASRERAEQELARISTEAKTKGRAEHLVERLIQSKTGKRVAHVHLDDLSRQWLSGARRGAISPRHAQVTEGILERFRLFMAERNPKAAFLYDVTAEDVGAYVEAMRRDFAPRTARGHAALLKAAFARALPHGAVNPFDGLGFRAKNGSGTIHRRPFTPAELQALIDAAGDDAMMRDLITVAACTGMRRADACNLRWDAVDFAGGMIAVKAAKTNEPVEVPIFKPLLAVLESRRGNRSEYVIPEAERMLEDNPQGISYRFKMIAAKALGAVEPTAEEAPEVEASEIKAKALGAIRSNTPEGPRRDRLTDGFTRYAAGESFREIEAATGIPRGVLSVDLRTVESWTGKRFVKSARTSGETMKEAAARLTRVVRAKGQRAASVYDFHALRTTFVTVALSSGTPMELVRRVTGHKTVEIVLGNYFRPGREAFKAALSNTLPDVLTGNAPTKETPLAELVAKIEAGTATQAERTRFKKLAAKL